ncbi:hypothetical protein DXG01_005940 [Tephrocybe rancida]|nr:hypothetical protein DXG01_005940 [Tephrocybe rancida]
MRSTAIQSRISAFESLNTPPKYPSTLASPSFPPKPYIRKSPPSPRSPPLVKTASSPSPSPPNLGRKTSLIDLKDWVVDDGPSPTYTGRFTAFGDVTDGATPTQHEFDVKRQLVAPLINLESPPRPKRSKPSGSAPPLPPRKPSYTSLKSVASSTSSHGSPRVPQRLDSLTVDHTYPPLQIDADSRSRHAPCSSISSFHSVSLSSDTDPGTPASSSTAFTVPDPEHEHDTTSDAASLGESYEEVSTPSIASPTTERIISLDWEKAMARRKQRQPPKLPQRPSPTSSLSSNAIHPHSALKSPPPKRPSSSSSIVGSPGYRASISSISSSSTLVSTTNNHSHTIPRKPPPPPPDRSSDRSSIQSHSSHSHSSHSHSTTTTNTNTPLLKGKRPTPVPLSARARYDSVFDSNVRQKRKAEKAKDRERPALLSPAEARGASRRAVGWRGLSVDLITGGHEGVPKDDGEQEEEDESGAVGPNERLEGHLIKTIWRRSRLGRRVLGAIWNECDPDGTGALTRDQFARGMWRVDEELRRAQILALKSNGARPPPVPRRKPILR